MNEDEDELVRTEACDSLCCCHDEETYEYLKSKAKKDKSGSVRGYAVISCVDIALEIEKKEDVNHFLNNLDKTEKKKR